MEQTAKKRPFLSPRVGTILGIVVIVIAVIGVLRSGPHELEHDSLFGSPPTPTVSITNLVSSMPLNYTVSYNGVQISFSKAVLAGHFSDDIKRGGNYIVRVVATTKNTTNDTIGVQYASLARLILPNGEVINAKMSSINAAEYPKQVQNGFIDFPISEKVDLSSLKLQFDHTTFPFSTK